MAGLAASTLITTAAAQAGTPNVRVLIRSGDVLGGETVVNVREPLIAPDGKWTALARFESPERIGLVTNGNLQFLEGDFTLDSRTIETIQQVSMSRDGVVGLLFEASNPSVPTNPTSRLRLGDTLILEEGDPISAPPFGVDGTIGRIIGFDYEAPTLAVAMIVRTPTGGTQRAFVAGPLSGSNFTVTGAIVDGTVMTGSTSGIPYYSPTSDLQALSNGSACHTIEQFDGTEITNGLRSLGDLLAEDGEPGDAPNSVWNFDVPPRVRANPAGSSIYSGRITLSNGQDRGSVYLDGTPVAIQGGGLNGVAGLAGDFQTASIAIADDGTPFYSIPLSTAGFEVLMTSARPVLRAGGGFFGTVVNGETIDTLFPSDGRQSFDITPDGRTVIQRARLSSGDTALLLAELDLEDPVTCTTVANSTGVSGEVSAFGSRFLDINDLRIVATELPLNSFGYLGIASTTVFVANPGGSNGNLCIGPTIGRYVDQVASSGTAGEITTVIDLTSIPQPTGFVSSLPGDTWYCQLWHRDSGPSGPASNFTDALAVTVQ